jgi:hypothetical protein
MQSKGCQSLTAAEDHVMRSQARRDRGFQSSRRELLRFCLEETPHIVF